jgi:hypothetical protein
LRARLALTQAHILKGAKPAELPQPNKFDLLINLTIVKAPYAPT